jgi:general stress protein YciG
LSCDEGRFDRHNRHNICQKHGITFQRTAIGDLADRNAVKLWIEEQLGRRNLTDDQRAVIADSVRERRSDAAKKERAAEAGKVGGHVAGRGRPKEIDLLVDVSNKPIRERRSDAAKKERAAEAGKTGGRNHPKVSLGDTVTTKLTTRGLEFRRSKCFAEFGKTFLLPRL